MSAMRLLPILMICFLLPALAVGQSKKKKKQTEEKSESSSAPTALDPAYQKESYVPKKSKRKSSQGPTYESEQQYYERMAKLVKEKKKAEKEMLKPQYSDPMYFGHKRPPKKNKAGKLK